MDHQADNENRQKGFYIKRLGAQHQKSSPRTKGIRKTARQCAREARERKKTYLHKLEADLQEANTHLNKAQDEVNHLKIRVKSLESSTANAGVANAGVREDGFEGLMTEFQRLFANVEANDSNQISRSLSILRDKFGISGRERFKNIDGLLDRLVKIIMPMHYRLLMENGSKNKQFYQLLGPRNSHKELVNLNEFSREVLLKIRPKVNQQKKEYDQILLQLADLRRRIRKQNMECQEMVDEIEDKLSPIYVARILLDLDCCRSKSGFDEAYPLNHWSEVKSGATICSPVQAPAQQNGYDSMLNYQFDEEILNDLFT